MEPATPLTPLESGVEMFTRGRPQSIVPVGATDAQRLSIVPEVDTPSSKASFLELPRATPVTKRPLSEVTEIYSDDEDDRTVEQDGEQEMSSGSEIDDRHSSDGEFYDEDYSEHGSDASIMETLHKFRQRGQVDSVLMHNHSTPQLQSEEWRQSGSSSSTFNDVQTPVSNRRGPQLRVNVRESCAGPSGPHLFRASVASSADYSRFSQALQMSPIQPDYLRSPDRFYKNSQAIAHALDSIDTPTTTITEDPYTIPPLGWSWQSEDATSWTAQQVTIWMQESRIENDVIECFAENDISGEILLKLELADLKELGIASFGKRHKVWNHICTLRNNQGRLSKRNTIAEEETSNRNSSHSKHSQSSCDVPLVTGPRRRRKPSNMLNPITPADSVSIVAIEQLLPKPHACAKGSNCPKYRKQQRIIEQLHKEHEFPVSPGNGGRIFMTGNPGNAATALKVISNPRQASQLSYECRPTSEALPSVIGPSVVASSDLLGPGEFPSLALGPEALETVSQRDPQDNVMSFLALQQIEPPMYIPPPFDPESPIDMHSQPTLRPVAPTAPKAALRGLPRLQIPGQNPILPFHHPADPSSAGPTMSAVDHYFSPELQSIPVVARFGTPASEMDAPVTQPQLGPVARDNSQSVPPNMQYRDQIERSASGMQDWRRPSLHMPSLQEEDYASAQPRSHAVMPTSLQRTKSTSSAPSDMNSPIALSSNAAGSLRQPPSSKTSLDLVHPSAALSSTSLAQDLYKNITHSGWMKKRKTKLLRHEWHQHHFRLNGDSAQLTMHRNDLPASSPLDTLNIDDYAVACSSVVANGKLAARFRALKLQSSKSSAASAGKNAADEAFSFQLVPTRGGESTSGTVSNDGGKLRKLPASSAANGFASASNGTSLGAAEAHISSSSHGNSRKTHHFAVTTRDERIDWMRELMLAKALREKASSGHEVEVVRGEKESVAAAAAAAAHAVPT